MSILSRAVLPALALLTACAPEAALDSTATNDGEAIGAQKVDVCHNTGNGSFHVINISQNAVQAHLNNHGDHLAGVFYLDADGDGQGDPGVTFDCMEAGTVDNGDDCDDDDANLNQNDADGDGDTTCDGDCDDANPLLNLADADADGDSTCDGDCDDANSLLNLADADGDGDTTCDGDCDDADPLLNLADADGDGFATCDGECDDSNASVNPGATEVCSDGIDNDCDLDIDEDCTAVIDVHVAGDNAVWVWLDGQPLTLDSMIPSWQIGRTAQVELDLGTTHALSFYVEDWGGLAYFAATVRVDGVPVASSGHGDFAQASSLLPYGSIAARENNWANQPDDASDSLNLLFSPGTTWGDWMQVGYDDATWGSDTNRCTSPSNWNTSAFVLSRVGFDEMYDDGAEFVWPQHGGRAAGSCSSWGWAAAAYRVEVAL